MVKHRGEVMSFARQLTGGGDFDPLMERIGQARVVQLGEASHGTHEFYAWRAALTRRLVPTRLAERYDAFCWFDETSALRPLHLEPVPAGELETYPTGV
jgi:erythromycin esterase-like protein